MKDKFSPRDQDESLLEKASQDELRAQIKQWQATDKLIRLLIFRLSLLVNSADPVLANNLQVLRDALRQGEDVFKLGPLVKDISNRIQPLVSSAVCTDGETSKIPGSDESEIKKQVYLIHDLLLVLLENINFPSAFTEEIKKIISSLRSAAEDRLIVHLIAAITALAEVLDGVFHNVKKDKRKIDLYLKQVNLDLHDLNEGMIYANNLQVEKATTEDEINNQMESHILEVQNVISDHSDVEQIRQAIQNSVIAMRDQLVKSRHYTAEYNKQTFEMMETLRNQLNHMESQYDDLKSQIREKNETSLSDPVTGIRNRLAYEEAIYLEVERYKRYGRPFTLLMFDVDNFKHISGDDNTDNKGDKVLQGVARIMSNCIRSVDFLARFGDDEFMIILPELGKEDGKRLAMKISKAVQDMNINLGGITLRATVSCGITIVKIGDTTESLFERVDLALYLAKQKGRNNIEVD